MIIWVVVLLVYNLQVISSDEAEYTTISSTNQATQKPSDEFQEVQITVELNKCGLRIAGPGIKWQNKVDVCSATHVVYPSVNPSLKGNPGLIGSKGKEGSQGARGLKGDSGDPGPIGASGSKGDKGERGSTEKGEKGVKGAKGQSIPGDRGPDGSPRPFNHYSLYQTKRKKISESGPLIAEAPDTRPGTTQNPATSFSEIEHEDEVSSGEYNFNPENSFVAECNFTEKSICLSLEDYFTENATCEEKTCWLFKPEFSFYKDQLQDVMYLAKIKGTTHSFQKLFISCEHLNLTQGPDFMQIQLSHILLIGPEQSENTPLYYKVNNGTCTTDNPEGSAEIDITIHGAFMPITNFYIRNGPKSLKNVIKKIAVCFYYQ